jgi:glycosyltransferase involved in cell wall biosynthesis
MTPWHVGVVVPACDEEALIAPCVASIRASVMDARLERDRVHIVVVADGCTDRTVAIARPLLEGFGTVLELDGGGVGGARRAGTAAVLTAFDGADPATVWLANTDADTTVPASWLTDHLRVAETGAMALAGVVRVDSFAGHPPCVPRQFHEIYGGVLDDHPHVHGANLGVRADAYLAVGGWPATTSGEDNGLWDALRAARVPTISTRTVHVVTSSRTATRATGGFGQWLVELADAG